MQFTIKTNPQAATQAQRDDIFAAPGFGIHFTDHMLSITYTQGTGWHSPTIEPLGSIALHPSAAVLHYGQEIFEGMKAYKHPNGSIWTFRPRENAKRFNKSAARMAMPSIAEDVFVQALEAFVKIEKNWVSSIDGQSLYLRPFMFATEVFLGVRPSHEYKFMIIASPVGSYFSGTIKPVSIWLSQNYVRAAKGGTGAAKCGGNYAAGLIAQQEAKANGCDQVVFVDAAQNKWVEELGGMNLFFVMQDKTLVTPPLGGTILEGVTRDSVLQLAKEKGLTVQERPVSIDEWKNGVQSGAISEIFACGTAAVITPVGQLVWDGGSVSGSSQAGEITLQLRNALVDIQCGRAPDTHGWLHPLA